MLPSQAGKQDLDDWSRKKEGWGSIRLLLTGVLFRVLFNPFRLGQN